MRRSTLKHTYSVLCARQKCKLVDGRAQFVKQARDTLIIIALIVAPTNCTMHQGLFAPPMSEALGLAHAGGESRLDQKKISVLAAATLRNVTTSLGFPIRNVVTHRYVSGNPPTIRIRIGVLHARMSTA